MYLAPKLSLKSWLPGPELQIVIPIHRAPGLRCPEPLHSPGGGDLATSLPRLAGKVDYESTLCYHTLAEYPRQ